VKSARLFFEEVSQRRRSKTFNEEKSMATPRDVSRAARVTSTETWIRLDHAADRDEGVEQ
jgi:hypothetical protein